MRFINSKNAKAFIHTSGKQVSKNALEALDRKVEQYLAKICKQYQGKTKRITAELIHFIKL